MSDLVHVTGRPEPEYRKISKVGAGYVFRKGRDYRCSECLNFIPGARRCMLFGSGDEVSANGYCTMWSYGQRPADDDHDWDDTPQSSYRPIEVGYGEKKNGTLCRRCIHFDKTASRCEIVSGEISPGGCCNNQSPD